MATPAQIAANRANSQKSTGPNTLEGRGRAAMNALVHGMRSAIEAERDQESEKYQRRFSTWMAEFDPPTDSLEYQLSKTLNLAMEVDRGESYSLMKRSNWLDEFDANLAEDARVLINRLFFDPNGPTALYGERGFRTKPGKPSASFSGRADDPNDPAKILIELEKTGSGCQLLLDEWTYLKSKLESRWESPDRFRAIRLLGAQPIDAKEQRHIAEIFLASHVKTGDNTNPFQDLKDEMLPSKTEAMEEAAYQKWPDIVRKNQKAAGRQLLARLVEENMKRLVDKLEAFDAEACGKKVFKEQSFDDSPEGKRLKLQVQKLDASVNRRLSKIRKECRSDQGDIGSRRAWRDAGKETSGRGERSLARERSGAGSAAGGATMDKPNLSWAYEYSARRDQEEGTSRGSAPATDVADPERGGSMIDRVLSHGFAGAEEVSRSEKSDGIGDEAEVGSSAAVQVADGENTATCEAGSEAGNSGIKPASDTNEANFDAHVINSQTPENLGVTAESAVDAALDTVVGMHVLSPDLVCPDSQQGSREETLVAGADEGNTATCEASPEAGDLEVKPESDTNKANFDAHVINSQAPEILGVTAESAVGAGLDTVAGMHVVSPDLVCPDSEQGSGEETLVAGADEGNTATCEASPEVGDLDVKPASDANEANLHGPVAGMCVGVGRVPGAENGGLPAEKQQSRGGGVRLSQMTEREKVQAMRERRRKNLESVLDAQKKLLRDLVSSSPEMGEMMRQQLPREP